MKALKRKIKEMKFEIKHEIKGGWFTSFVCFKNGEAKRKLDRAIEELEKLKAIYKELDSLSKDELKAYISNKKTF